MGPSCARAFLFLYFLSSLVTAEYGHSLNYDEQRKRTAEVDVLLEVLYEKQWKEEDLPCFQAFQKMLHGVKNSTLWATWMWDSMQRPTGSLYGAAYHMGSFDQCLNPPWRQTHQHLNWQYCAVEMQLTDAKTPTKWTGNLDPYDSTEAYFKTTSKHGRHFNKATVGVCLPSVCSDEAATTIALLMMSTTHLPEPRHNPVLLSCQQGGDSHKYSAGFTIFMLTLSFIFGAAVFGTMFPEYVPSGYVASEIRLAFDIKRNWSKLFEVSSRELLSVHGIRSINAMILICTHFTYYCIATPILNGMHLERDVDTFLGMFLLHLDLTVDTFFAISGMLLMTGLMSGKRKNLIEGLVKRYIRIIGPLAVMVLYFSWVHEHVGSGPLWTYLSGRQRDLCHNNWWATMFMVNNYVNEDQICHTVTWYLACDFQLAVLGTFLYYLYQRDQKTGKIIIALAAVAAVLTPSIVTYKDKLSPLFFHGIHGLINFTQDEVFLKRYIKAHCRAAAYLVGMYMGYIFSTYKPEENRNKLSKGLSILGFLAAFSVLVTVYRGGGLLFFREYNALEVAAFVAVNRATWALAVCCLIAICEYGTLPLISALLKWNFFVPLSRLSYSLYLIHMAVVYYTIHGARTGVRYDFIALMIQGLGSWVIVNMLSVLLWLLVEAPVSNLSIHLFKTRKTAQAEKNGKIETNGNIVMNGHDTHKLKST